MPYSLFRLVTYANMHRHTGTYILLSFSDTSFIAICQKDINQTVVHLAMSSLVQQVRFIDKFSQLIFLFFRKRH